MIKKFELGFWNCIYIYIYEIHSLCTTHTIGPNQCRIQRQKQARKQKIQDLADTANTYRPLVGSLMGNRTSSVSLARTTEFNPESTVPTSSEVNSANSWNPVKPRMRE